MRQLPGIEEHTNLHDLYQDCVVWRLGTLGEVEVNAHAHDGIFISSRPAGVLFPDEIMALRQDTTCLIVDQQEDFPGFIYVYTDAYFHHEGSVYRLYGSYID